MPISYLDDPADELDPLDEQRFSGPRRPFQVQPPAAAPRPQAQLPNDVPPVGAPEPSVSPELLRLIQGGNSRSEQLGPNPRQTDYEGKLKTEADIKSAPPKEGSPKWWQRLAAAGVGAAAGYENASGHRNHIDPTGAVDAIMGGPSQRKRLSDWQDKVQGAEAQSKAAKGTLDEWQQGRSLDRQDELADATTEHLRAQSRAKPEGVTLSPGQVHYERQPDGSMKEVAAAEATDKPVKTLEQRVVEILDGTDPEPVKQTKLKAVVDAHNKLHPTTPIHGIETDDRGNSTLVIADPSSPQNVQRIPLGGIGKSKTLPASVQNKDAVAEAIERSAQALANGDLTRLREISSLRGDQRLLLFDRAKQINPKFNTADIDRKIKMEDYYANGKGAANLQSFGTFLEHGGAAMDAAAAINQGNPRLLNKPINWWKSNMSGDPTFQSFVVALEPVRKEFEGFLLGGRALYGDDRKQAEIILNDSSSLGQVQAALKQMGHTAQARMNEENYRYKKQMGHDLVDPLSPEAIAGAQRIGLNLGPKATSPGVANGQQQPAAAIQGPKVGDIQQHNGDTYKFDGTNWVKQAKANGR